MIEFTKEQRRILRREINRFGENTVTDYAIEELTKLINLLMKDRYNRANGYKEFPAVMTCLEVVNIRLEQIMMMHVNSYRVEYFKKHINSEVEALEKYLDGFEK